MAIGPGVLSDKLKNECAAFESLIDDKLSKSRAYDGIVTMDPPQGGFTEAHLDVLRPRYLSAGWDSVELCFGGKNETNLTFKQLVKTCGKCHTTLSYSKSSIESDRDGTYVRCPGCDSFIGIVVANGYNPHH